MGSIGPAELMVVLVLALLVFGPKKLPEIGRGVGQAIREFKRHSRDLMSYLEEEPEPRQVYPEPTPALRPTESIAANSVETETEPVTEPPQNDAVSKPAVSEPAAPVSPTPSNTHPTV
jgi:sec-independent protein translocase protein TatA